MDAFMSGVQDTANVDLDTGDTFNYYDNAEVQYDVAEADQLNWNDRDIMAKVSFGDMLGMVRNNEDTDAIANGFREDFMAHYRDYAARLPPVCADGEQCRENIRVELR